MSESESELEWAYPGRVVETQDRISREIDALVAGTTLHRGTARKRDSLSVILSCVTRPQTYDGYSALHTQISMYLNGAILSVECES